jgi:DASS family divalent anion:Na+ symporter
MWVFELMPEFVPPLVSVVAVILLDIASPQVALSGFVSDTFFMCLSVFAVGALMVSSGLTYRLSLRLLSFMPSNRFGYNLSLFISGVLLAPVIPSPNGRMTMIAPFCVDLVDGSKPRPRDPGASEFLSTAVNGIALPAAIFLTGKPANLIVLGMFDYQTQYIFQWLSWLQAAAVVGVILLVAHFVVSAVVFRGSHKFGIPRGVLQEQVKALGPLSGVERGALIAVVVLAVGIVTTSLHKIDIPWVALATLTVLLMFGLVGRLDLRTRVDWPLLIFIGTIVAWVPVMQKTGLDKLIIKNLGWLGAYMKTDLQLFIGILCVLVVLVRFALPGGATTIIFATAMFPLATAAGVSPWLVGFVILVMSESHILPYQQPYDLQTRSLLVSNKMEHVIDDNRTVLFHVLMTFVRIGAIYASMPYWRYLGIV